VTGNGLAFGTESSGLDINAFNGTEEDLYKYANALGISPTPLTMNKSTDDFLPDSLKGDLADDLKDPQLKIE
jgi:hypothetical protein